MFILGLSATEHDPAAALIDGQGAIVAAIGEGKLGRSRTLAGIPDAAIRFCLNRAGIGWRDIKHVAIARQPGRSWVQNPPQTGRHWGRCLWIGSPLVGMLCDRFP